MEAIVLTIVNALMGPAGALILAVIILYAIYKLLVDHLIPIIKDWFDSNKNVISNILNSHDEDRKVYKETIELLSKKFDDHDTILKEIKEDIGEIKEKVST